MEPAASVAQKKEFRVACHRQNWVRQVCTSEEVIPQQAKRREHSNLWPKEAKTWGVHQTCGQHRHGGRNNKTAHGEAAQRTCCKTGQSSGDLLQSSYTPTSVHLGKATGNTVAKQGQQRGPVANMHIEPLQGNEATRACGWSCTLTWGEHAAGTLHTQQQRCICSSSRHVVPRAKPGSSIRRRMSQQKHVHAPCRNSAGSRIRQST